MERELETYFQNYFELFGTPGWKQLMSDLEAQYAAALGEFRAAKTEIEVGSVQGQLNQVDKLLNLEAQLTAVYEAQKAEEE